MEKITETRLDTSKVTHIKITDSFNGIDTGWGVKQYKYCEAKYTKFLWWSYLNYKEGFWKDGKQYSSCITPMYEMEEIFKNEKHLVHDFWVHTKASVKVFVGEEKIRELFFDNLLSAKRYCDINFHNVNFVI